MSVYEVKPVRLPIAVRRVWQQFSRANPSVYSLVPPSVADVIVDCTLCRQSNKRTLLLLLLLADEHPASTARRAEDGIVCGHTSVADGDIIGIQYSLKLVGVGLGQYSENGVAVVHTRRHEGVNSRSRVLSLRL